MPPKTPPDFRDKTTPPQATIRVGPHVITLERERYEAWEQSIAAEVGFSKTAFAAEIKKRLGM